MEMHDYYKAIVDVEPSAIVICDTDHTILYMNPAARERYKNRGGDSLLGRSLKNCHNAASNMIMDRIMDWFRASKDNNIMYAYYSECENKDVYVMALRNSAGELIGYYEKHKYLSREKGEPYAGL